MDKNGKISLEGLGWCIAAIATSVSICMFLLYE